LSEPDSVELIAYCGLYCGDCAGHSGELADAARALLDRMEEYRFDITARGLFADQFKDYDGLVSMLEFMSDTRCRAACRARDRTCAIARCCVDRGYSGCYECDEFKKCRKLGDLAGVHGDSCIRNLEGIRELGPEAWVAKGKRLWFGSDVDRSRQRG
jgi:hypothetical protein